MAPHNSRVQFGKADKGRTTKASESGRVCRAEGCTTVLSIYNDAADCSLHERQATKLSPRRG